MWNEFGCTNMLDYHNLYLKCDVLQLADVFETFRNTAIKNTSSIQLTMLALHICLGRNVVFDKMQFGVAERRRNVCDDSSKYSWWCGYDFESSWNCKQQVHEATLQSIKAKQVSTLCGRQQLVRLANESVSSRWRVRVG